MASGTPRAVTAYSAPVSWTFCTSAERQDSASPKGTSIGMGPTFPDAHHPTVREARRCMIADMERDGLDPHSTPRHQHPIGAARPVACRQEQAARLTDPYQIWLRVYAASNGYVHCPYGCVHRLCGYVRNCEFNSPSEIASPQVRAPWEIHQRRKFVHTMWSGVHTMRADVHTIGGRPSRRPRCPFIPPPKRRLGERSTLFHNGIHGRLTGIDGHETSS